MARPPIQATEANWATYHASLQRQGVPLAHYYQIMKQDITNVRNGHSPLPKQQILAMISAASGRPVIGNKDRPTGIMGLVNNFGPDVADIVRGFIPGVVNFAHHLPSETMNTIEALGGNEAVRTKLGMDPATSYHHGILGNMAEALRNVAKLPLLQVVPGVHTAAGLTSGAGRKELQQQPAGTLLDLIPAATEAGKLATLGKVEEVAKAAAQAGVEGVSAKVIREVRSPTNIKDINAKISAAGVDNLSPAQQAFARGQFLKGVFRSIPRAQYSASVIAKAMGVNSSLIEDLARPISKLTKESAREAMRQWHEEIAPAVNGLSDAESEMLFRAGNDPIHNPPSTLTPKLQAVMSEIRKASDNYTQRASEQGLIVPVAPLNRSGPLEYFARDSNVIKQDRAFKEAAHVSANLNDELRSLQSRAINNDKTAMDLIPAKQEEIRKAGKVLDTAQKTFGDSLTRDAPLRYHGILNGVMHDKETVLDLIRRNNKIKGENLQAAIDDLEANFNAEGIEATIGRDNFNLLKADVIAQWRKFAEMGQDPVWLANIPKEKIRTVASSRPLSKGGLRPEQFKKEIFDFTPGVENVAVGLTGLMSDTLRADGTKQFATTYLPSIVIDAEKAFTDTRQAMTWKNPINGHVHIPTDEEVRLRMAKDYMPLMESSAKGLADLADIPNRDKLLFPKGFDAPLRSLLDPVTSQFPLFGAYKKGIEVFKVAVLTAPRHFAHVAFGGAMFATVRGDGPALLRSLGKAYRQVREGVHPIEMDYLNETLRTEDVFHAAAGRTMGRLFGEIWNAGPGKAITAFHHLEDTVGTMQRVAVMLEGDAKYLRKGFTPEMARNEAIHLSNKIFVDMDALTPIERSIIKQVIPFYAFTKHLFRYLFTLPADHPIRAAILARFAEQEKAEWATGLPTRLMSMFSLGGADAFGNTTEITYRAINPFRSIANDFTLAGFAESLNPFMTGVLDIMGVDKFSGSPELYPALAYDENTGTLVAKREDVMYKLLHDFIPPAGVIDHFIQQTEQMKRLAENSPEGFRRQLFDSLGIPFSWGKINRPYVAANAERHRYQLAQSLVTQAMQTGNADDLKAWSHIPFRGQFFTPNQFEDIIRQIVENYGQTDPVTGKPLAPGAELPRGRVKFRTV